MKQNEPDDIPIPAAYGSPPGEGIHMVVCQYSNNELTLQWNLRMWTCLGPPVCVLIIEVALFERLINILMGHLGLVQVS